MGRFPLPCVHVLLLAGAVALALPAGSCAGTECNFNSQCGPGRYCQAGSCGQDCRRDTDCNSDRVCNEVGRCVPPSADSGIDRAVPDGATDATVDATTPDARVDASIPDATLDAIIDATPDAMLGSAIYLDRCNAASDCASGSCVPDVGGSRFCTKRCASNNDCAVEHVCSGGFCARDDTGESCSVAAPATCSLGLCVGPAGGMGACTRECASAADCPSGFACSRVGGTKVCLDIEQPCVNPSDCGSQACLSVQGCTANCESAADCPARLAGLPPYTCANAFGSASPICVPPADILGPDPTGQLCRFSGVQNFCRSGGCNSADPLGPTCTQTCTAEGGCGPGLGCFPEPDGASFTFICIRGGSGALGSACGSARECDSAICAMPGYCTRLCFDGFCPTGMTCRTDGGVSICRR
ncbi:MAG: hypothetical protein AAGF12_01520 [Myxococcota bacterium]